MFLPRGDGVAVLTQAVTAIDVADVPGVAVVDMILALRGQTRGTREVALKAAVAEQNPALARNVVHDAARRQLLGVVPVAAMVSAVVVMTAPVPVMASAMRIAIGRRGVARLVVRLRVGMETNVAVADGLRRDGTQNDRADGPCDQGLFAPGTRFGGGHRRQGDRSGERHGGDRAGDLGNQFHNVSFRVLLGVCGVIRDVDEPKLPALASDMEYRRVDIG